MKNLLPLGSIVELSKTKRKYMIIGRLAKEADSEKVYDYMSCGYPEGMFDAKRAYLFDQSDIRNIVFEGFSDELEDEFQKFLRDNYSNLLKVSNKDMLIK